MIIGCDMMVQLGLSDEFKSQVLKWGGINVPMKVPRGLLGQTDLTSRDMREVVMQTAEPVSARDATDRAHSPPSVGSLRTHYQ